MAIYQVTKKGLSPIKATNFSDAGFREREHLQQLIKRQIDVISPDTLVISEEFGNWDNSRRRIDLLGVDKDANLVVIELKRTEDGGHMELQAIRYAAMVSVMTFGGAVEVFATYLSKSGQEGDARDLLLEFLGWDEPDEEEFAQDVRIILASAEFSKEVTTSVLWLNERSLDIRCVRLRPYQDGDQLLLDVQQVIPLPEAEEYQIQIRNKSRLERVARTQSRDLTKFDVIAGDQTFSRLPKRRAIYQVIRYLCDQGVDPEEIRQLLAWRGNSIRVIEGNLGAVEFKQQLAEQQVSEGKKSDPTRYYIEEDELFHTARKTFALTKMWGPRTAEAIDQLLEAFPNHQVSYRENLG
ncbi:MAG: hypothetical protein DHS20C01_32450 [marine bacterium B5-7]|nr:MAG: hypothetical protein DHS20C01_32450 [marine bacterium B5-7]